MKGSSGRARRCILGAVAAAVVGGGAFDSPALAQTAPPGQTVTIETTVTVPHRCTITTTRALDGRAAPAPGAVITAVVAVCTRGSSQTITVRVPSSAADCERLALPGGSATACGGSPAAEFVRSLGGNPSSELRAYVSVFDGVALWRADDHVAIDF